MKCTIKAFGITKDILGKRELVLEVSEGSTVADLRHRLQGDFPALNGLKSLFIAINNAYADEGKSIQESDEIALIPPVSGG
jgi:molybdopterin converting factor subunit 1